LTLYNFQPPANLSSALKRLTGRFLSPEKRNELPRPLDKLMIGARAENSSRPVLFGEAGAAFQRRQQSVCGVATTVSAIQNQIEPTALQRSAFCTGAVPALPRHPRYTSASMEDTRNWSRPGATASLWREIVQRVMTPRIIADVEA